MINLIRKLAIQSQTNTLNVVVMDNVMEGVDGAATFGYSVTPEALKVNDGQTQQHLHRHSLDVRVLQASGTDLTKLRVMDENQEDVIATTYGLDGSVLFRDGAKMVRQPQFDELVADRFLITRTTPPGKYGSEAAQSKGQAVVGSGNLLDIWDTKSGSTVLLNGWSKGSSLDTTQGSGIQTGIRTASGGFPNILSPLIFYPFPGSILEAEVEVTAISTTTDNLILIEAFDINSSSISSLNTGFSTTGIKKISFTMPTATVYVRFYILVGGGIADSISFKNPVLRVIS